MVARVRCDGREELKVPSSIVRLDPVLVVHNFSPLQWTTKHLLHDNAMLLSPSAVSALDSNVTLPAGS